MVEVCRYPVMVVDDDDSTRLLVQKQLSKAGYDVNSHPDARTCLEAVCQMPVGIVIADWNMPEMDGLELCQAVRDLEQMQAVQHIYFILLTAHTRKEQVVKGLESGANDYLTKPYHPGELLARVQVGQRMLRLQSELFQRNIEVQKANARMALLARELDEQANTDAMTGLPNRRRFFEKLAETWTGSERRDEALSCIMLDVDHFKRVNDTYGHAIGDEVLRAVAGKLRQSARRPDLCARFGGEEFIMLCPTMGLEDAGALADGLRANVCAAPVDSDGTLVNVSVSCGVCMRGPAVNTTEELILRADAMLYAAKENGRNQVWVTDGAETQHRFVPEEAAAATE